MQKLQNWKLVGIGGFLLALNACLGASGSGEGGIKFHVSGEEAAKTGFPVILPGKTEEVLEFVDGWQLEWEAYVVSLGQISLIDSQGETAIEDKQIYVVDLHTGDPEIATFADLPAQRWDRFSFAVTAPTEDAVNINVDSEIFAQMQANNYNYWIQGTASKDEQTVRFAWGIKNPTKNSDCTNGLDDTQGIVVQTGKTEAYEITFHLEHMFWSSLGTEINEMRFAAIAAMADENGSIAWDELKKQNLADLKNAEGEPLTDDQENPVIYNPGSANLPEDNLQEFIQFSMASQAHFNGSGLCTIASP